MPSHTALLHEGGVRNQAERVVLWSVGCTSVSACYLMGGEWRVIKVCEDVKENIYKSTNDLNICGYSFFFFTRSQISAHTHIGKQLHYLYSCNNNGLCDFVCFYLWITANKSSVVRGRPETNS